MKVIAYETEVDSDMDLVASIAISAAMILEMSGILENCRNPYGIDVMSASMSIGGNSNYAFLCAYHPNYALFSPSKSARGVSEHNVYKKRLPSWRIFHRLEFA
ncbi:hypothetical protein AVEN_82578-1 [Araneus ventricosus]|uniref:Uncharacterized protein n=1 Tax=Araneus ventricosus TaxID=182803 RepID=A0A4Y2IV03_ARAVE|nr:hypothetical protein AVEN_82578-1 [Araneus ventricosus]